MTKEKTKLAVFVSHGGSNFQAIIEACQLGKLNAEIKILFCNNQNAYAIQRAQNFDIDYHLINRDSSIAEIEILKKLAEYSIDFIILAGYNKIISSLVLEAYKLRVINIHPALLPKFGGKGMYGLRVHEAVIAAKEKESGVTVHLVSEEYDQGTILAQQKIVIEDSDTAESLQAKLLKIEHILYPAAIGDYINSFQA